MLITQYWYTISMDSRSCCLWIFSDHAPHHDDDDDDDDALVMFVLWLINLSFSPSSLFASPPLSYLPHPALSHSLPISSSPLCLHDIITLGPPHNPPIRPSIHPSCCPSFLHSTLLLSFPPLFLYPPLTSPILLPLLHTTLHHPSPLPSLTVSLTLHFLSFYLCISSLFPPSIRPPLSPSTPSSRMLRWLVCGRLGPVWMWKALLLFVAIAFAGQLLGVIFNKRYLVSFTHCIFVWIYLWL